MLALISKAQFERGGSAAKVGDRLGIERYDSKSKQLRPLEEGGALFLVTVRPGEQLWLVGVLEAPTFDGKRWSAAPSVVPVADITRLRGELRFTTGMGISDKVGALGMSLQTPRQLTAEDVAQLRRAVGGESAAPDKMATPKKKTRAKKKTESTPAPATASAVAPAQRPLPAEAGALLGQILADPDDLDARRVYADLLMEHGDPQGEQIQLACALEQMAPDDPRWGETLQTLESREHRHGLAWSRGLRQIGGFNLSREGGSGPFSFARGFPERLCGKATAIVPSLDQAARVAPLRSLDLEVDPGGLEALAAASALAQIRALVLRCTRETPTGSVIALLASPHLRRLEHLEIQGRLSAELAAALARCPALAGCRELSLVDNAAGVIGPDGLVAEPTGLGPEGLRTLCEAAGLVRLEALTLGRARVGHQGLAALGALEKLRRLSISDEELGVRATRALAGGPGRNAIEELALERCGLDAKALPALVEAPSFASLRRLQLRGNRLGRGIGPLLEALELPRLESLGLGEGQIREAGARLLAASGKLQGLVTLDVSGCGLKDAGCEALAGGSFPRLRTLRLLSNGIAAGGLEALARGPLLSTVRDLDLAGNKFQNAGGQALAASPHLAHLERLRFHYNWLGVGGLKAILARTPALLELRCGENNYANAPGQVVASGSLPRLRHLSAYQQNGPTVTALARSEAGRRLETLGLDGAPVITDEGAAALAELPNLGSLQLSFPSISAEGMAALRRRFGPFLSVWPSVEKWNALPGPD